MLAIVFTPKIFNSTWRHQFSKMDGEKVNLKTYKQMFEAFSTTLYYDEDRKRYHGVNTALIAKILAEETGLADPSRLFYTGLIHDLGGLGLDHHIVHLNMENHLLWDSFSPAVVKQVRKHGPRGAKRLKEYEGFDWTVPLVKDHHERYDGSGYPEGKEGRSVSEPVELLGVADTLDVYLFSMNQSAVEDDTKRVEEYKRFLETHGGFRKKIRDKALELANRRELVQSLRSISTREKMVESGIEELTPPGGIHLEGIVELLGSVVDIKSNYTEDHSDRVAKLGEELGKRLDMSEKELSDYHYAAYLHDLGKVRIDRSILTKPRGLTDQEYEKIKRHPVYSREILSEIKELEEVAKITGQHHERYDGTGYPEGLEGEEIKLGARALSVVDAWDAMTTDRPYQEALDKDEAIMELKENAGSQFDPRVVDEFLQLIEV